MTENRIERIRTTLEEALSPLALEIIDESHKHAGHASAGGGGHFIVQIASAAFTGKSTIQRHRMVYEAMAELMKSNEVHALSIQAHSPEEV